MTDEEIAKMEIKEFTEVYRRVIALEKENEKNIQAMAKQGEAKGKLNVEVSELKGKLAGYEKVGDSVAQSGRGGAINLQGISWVTVAMKNKKRNEEKAKLPQAQIEITNSILNEMSERDEKKKNVIVFGLPVSLKVQPEARKTEDSEAIQKLLEHMAVKSKCNSQKIIRYKPKSESNQHPPVIIKFNNEQERNNVLSAAKKLRDSDDFLSTSTQT